MQVKRKKLWIIVIAVLVIAAAIWLLFGSKADTQEKYNFVKIEKGDLEAVVSSTGTLSAVTTVQVGCQVSGRIAKLLVDFNSKVKQGDLLAEIDRSVWLQAVYDSETALDRSKLQYDQAQLDLKRIKILFDQQLKTQNDLDQAQYNFNVAKTNLKSSQSNLEKAKINLAYCSIYSPIDGTVIARNVDVGQTVASSFSSPTLFLIANDLKKMQIQAQVDESDIGQIKVDQKIRFTVQAFTNRKFEGIVSQIRLQPQTISNVVNYTVVVNVDNADNQLLPGMTATLDFIIGQAKGVFKVSNAALRIKPSAEMMQILQKEFQSRAGDRARSGSSGAGDAGSQARPASENRGGQTGSQGQGGNFMRMLGGGNNSGGSQRRRDFALIWYLDEKGDLKMIPVRTGLNDGQFSEIKSDKIKEGMTVIKTINEDTSLSGQMQGGRPPMRMF